MTYGCKMAKKNSRTKQAAPAKETITSRIVAYTAIFTSVLSLIGVIYTMKSYRNHLLFQEKQFKLSVYEELLQAAGELESKLAKCDRSFPTHQVYTATLKTAFIDTQDILQMVEAHRLAYQQHYQNICVAHPRPAQEDIDTAIYDLHLSNLRISCAMASDIGVPNSGCAKFAHSRKAKIAK